MSMFTDKQLLVIGGVALAGLWYVKTKSAQALNAVNPLNEANIFNDTVEDIFGAENVATAGDYVFGGLTLLNPWADDAARDYAEQVYGLGGDDAEN